jgi:hypothetical protein
LSIIQRERAPVRVGSVHAGIPDTSEMLHLSAGFWIREDQIAAANESSGVQGSPIFASPELGKIYLDMKVANAVNQIRSFLTGSK